MIGVRRRSGTVCVFACAEEAREGEDGEQGGERRWGIDAVIAARARHRGRHHIAVSGATAAFVRTEERLHAPNERPARPVEACMGRSSRSSRRCVASLSPSSVRAALKVDVSPR